MWSWPGSPREPQKEGKGELRQARGQNQPRRGTTWFLPPPPPLQSHLQEGAPHPFPSPTRSTEALALQLGQDLSSAWEVR